MELKAFNNSKWVEPEGWEDVKFKVDYPTQDQKYILESIMQESTVLDNEGKPESYKMAEWNKFTRHYLRFTVKDWKGITSNGKEIKCKLVNNELEESLWNGITADDGLAGLLYDAINKALKWDATDKKK